MIQGDIGVLIVDDSEMARELNKQILKKMGYKNLQTAENGRIALEKIESGPAAIGLILSDGKMPDIDGSELLQRLRANKITAKVPFLLISAVTEISALIGTTPGPYTAYLPKPFKPADLVSAIENLLSHAADADKQM